MQSNADTFAGSLSVLNTGAGDIVITFNQYDDAERAKALAMLHDMQRRGYAILVRLPDNTYARAQDIDTVTGSYVINLPADFPPIEGEILEAGKTPALLAAPPSLGDLSMDIKVGPPLPGIPPIMAEEGGLPRPDTAAPDPAPEVKRRGRPPSKTVKLPIEKTHATGIARSAGG